MDLRSFRALSSQHRALVAVAVLLDGREAMMYLENDAENGQALKKAAHELSSQDSDFRMPYAGSALRRALEELQSAGENL